MPHADHLIASFATGELFLAAFDSQILKGGLFIPGASAVQTTAMGPCTVEIRVGDHPGGIFPGRVAASIPGVGVAVIFEGLPDGLRALAARLRSGEGAEPVEQDLPPDESAIAPPAGDSDLDAASEEDPGPESAASLPNSGAEQIKEDATRGTVFERIEAMTTAQKMQVALKGDREERFAILRDINRTLHVYVLRNPKVGLDEVQYASRMPGISADALKLIVDHRDWGSNTTVCGAIARNPTAPISLALKVLDRVSINDLRAIAKGGARMPLVQAARKKLANP